MKFLIGKKVRATAEPVKGTVTYFIGGDGIIKQATEEHALIDFGEAGDKASIKAWVPYSKIEKIYDDNPAYDEPCEDAVKAYRILKKAVDRVKFSCKIEPPERNHNLFDAIHYGFGSIKQGEPTGEFHWRYPKGPVIVKGNADHRKPKWMGLDFAADSDSTVINFLFPTENKKLPPIGSGVEVSLGKGEVKAHGNSAGRPVIFVQGFGWTETTCNWTELKGG